MVRVRLWIINALRSAHDFTSNRWLISGFFSAFPAFCGLYLTFYGTESGIIKAGVIDPGYKTVFFSLFWLSVFYAFLSSFGTTYRKQNLEAGQTLVEKILHTTNKIVTKKQNKICATIRAGLSKGKIKDYLSRSIQPEAQISVILNGLCSCVNEMFSKDSNVAVSACVVFKVEGSDAWEWIKADTVDDGMTLAKLIASGSKSAIKPIIDGEKSLIYYENKKTAFKNGHYIPAPLDEGRDMIGSVVCYRADIGSDRPLVRAVLCFSTYGKQLASEGDNHAKNKIVSTLLTPFLSRIQFELTTLYFKRSLDF